MQAKKLIEVAMPIKEISAESVRDKSIRHGHISTLHLWWARRPLPVSRAVVFASLVPDPNDENCPLIFKEAVDLLLGSINNPGDPYKPYDDIPYTSAIDKMEDNSRNRLLMFIGKFSNKYIENEKKGKNTDAKNLISEFSLIKWENKDNEKILSIARKLIWVNYNSQSNSSLSKLLIEFDNSISEIKEIENSIYSKIDRHLNYDEQSFEHLNNKIKAFLSRMPMVFDPFTGGGSLPLEAARLGCRSFGNDINPVAHIIQKGSLEYPQKFGKPIKYSKTEFIKRYGLKEWENQPNDVKTIENGDAVGVALKNRLAFDVEYYSKLLLKKTEEEVGYLYPNDAENNKLISYFNYRTAKCANPTCAKDLPLIRNFCYSNKTSKPINLDYDIIEDKLIFKISRNSTVKKPFIDKGNLTCPHCKNVTPNALLKEQFLRGEASEMTIASVYESNSGKTYKIESSKSLDIDISGLLIPSEIMDRNSAGGDTFGWGITKWEEIYNPRQIMVINSLIANFNNLFSSELNEYEKAIATYLSIFIDKITLRLTRFGVWHNGAENVEHLYGRQAISMKFEYPEANIFSNTTSGSALNQLEGILRYINGESFNFISVDCKNASSGELSQFHQNELDATVTDPPYYDAISYADLSDFFYVWLKKYMVKIYPLNFSTPKTPKAEECTALKFHHGGDKEKAKNHFETKLMEIFSAIEYQTKKDGIVSIMFAHQSTDAWTTLCNSILGAKMNITGSWAIESEQTSALKSNHAFLASSVTVSARPETRSGYGEFRVVKKEIEETVSKEVDELYRLGFRGADLLTACFGQAVSVFGKYEKVEKADGNEVLVPELLELARESAFNALLKGFSGDDFTKFYIGWLQLYGFSTNDHNTALRIVQVGLSININDLYKENILIQSQNQSTLANFQERNLLIRNLGEKTNSTLIDQVQKAMWLYKGTSRNLLLEFINKVAISTESNFWRVITSICEILPNGTEDYIQAIGLLTNKESLIKESQNLNKNITEQGQLEF